MDHKISNDDFARRRRIAREGLAECCADSHDKAYSDGYHAALADVRRQINHAIAIIGEQDPRYATALAHVREMVGGLDARRT